MGGQNFGNTRSQADQTKLSPSTAPALAVKWTQQLHGDISATPAVVGGVVYVPDWGQWAPYPGYGTPNTTSTGGYLTAMDENSGAIIWQRRIDSYAGEPAGAVSRTSPAVVNGVVYIGDQNGAHLLAINASNGTLLWSTQINPHPLAIITQSPMVYGGVIYVGAASTEEGAAANPKYQCCSFQGSFSAVNATTGQILWTFHTIPAPNTLNPADGYSGGAVWGSTPAIDPQSKTVFITTGNNYTVPSCVLDGSCNIDQNDYFDSILALDMATGNLKWVKPGWTPSDAWTVGCISTGANCPSGHGPDFDFGSGANLFTAKNPDGSQSLVVGAGQKAGLYWLLNAADGSVRWVTQVGVGSSLGGIEWGTATDGKRIYVESSNVSVPNGSDGNPHGVFAALDVATGNILWQMQDPTSTIEVQQPDGSYATKPAYDLGAVSASNGVMFASSLSGSMYALDASSGNILWHYQAFGTSSVASGPAIDLNGSLYWGSGYSHLGFGNPGSMFYAFSINGK